MAAERQQTARADGDWRATAVTLGLVLASAACVLGVRGRLAQLHRTVKETSDVYVLPPPDQVVRLALGYRSALVDLLWGHVLVSQGLHTLEKRRFENLSLLLDSINELEPTFRAPYLAADFLFTFQGGPTPHEEVVKARQVMERGVAALPLDGELWLALGQFVAYIAPGTYLTDPKEQTQWRMDGAKMLARAADLSAGDASIGWQALGGAGIYRRAGERDAAIRFIQRSLAVTDDPELKERLQQDLRKHASEDQIEAYEYRISSLVEIRKGDLPFVSANMMFVLGPPIDPAFCAGTAHEGEPKCAPSWREWATRITARTR